MSITAMKQTLEALEWVEPCERTVAIEKAITSLRQAIQEEALRNVQRLGQEIEEEAEKQERNFCERCGKRLGNGIHTCTPPAKREWVGLTDEEIKQWRLRFKFSKTLVKEVEAKIREKAGIP